MSWYVGDNTTTKKIIEFEVRGKPEPQGSIRAFVVKGRPILTSTNKSLSVWRRLIADVAQQHAPTPIVTAPLTVTLLFRLPKPKSAPKKKRTYPIHRPDIDKLARAVLDALTNIIYSDDAQVIRLHIEKDWGDPGVRICITAEAVK